MQPGKHQIKSFDKNKETEQISTEQIKHLSEAYIMSAFKCCLFIWMFCNKTSNCQINKKHERTLCLVYEM